MVGALILAAASAAACTRSTSGEWFTDVTDRAGLHFVHDAGPTGAFFFPQIVGSGGGFLDFDNDGRLDIYLLQNAPGDAQATNRLYHQEADGTFRDVSAGSGLDVAGYGMGMAVGDINNDGWSDVLVTEYGRLRLFVNNRNGTFTDVTHEAGLDTRDWGTSATFFDYDRDGWLDLVVANYVNYDEKRRCWPKKVGVKQDFCGPNAFGGGVSRLYHHLGASNAGVPHFADVTKSAGLDRKGAGLGVVAADFNGEHWPDIFVANDGMANHLWINQRDGTFTEDALARGLAFPADGAFAANMGIAVGDLNGDGLLDAFVTHLESESHTAWMQGPAGLFQDRTRAIGLAKPKWHATGFGTLLGDFDQDGALDLALANGAVLSKESLEKRRPSEGFMVSYAQRNQLFANDGSGLFADVSDRNPAFSEPPGVSRGLAMGDLDGDGALDLLVTRVGASARLFRNVAPGRGHWLQIRAILPALGGRDAYGAEVTVRAGAKTWTRIVNPGFSYLVSNAPAVHIGLGRADRIDAITVVWPDGAEERFPGGAVDRALVLREGTGTRERVASVGMEHGPTSRR